MIWVALYSTITFGLSIVVFISYLIILYKIKRNKRELKIISEGIEAQRTKRAQDLKEMRELEGVINSSIFIDEYGEMQWLKK